jgi:hypothetical protein
MRSWHLPPAVVWAAGELGAAAEEEGFEPPVACTTAVFKTAAFDHSATPPKGFQPTTKDAAALQVFA